MAKVKFKKEPKVVLTMKGSEARFLRTLMGCVDIVDSAPESEALWRALDESGLNFQDGFKEEGIPTVCIRKVPRG